MEGTDLVRLERADDGVENSAVVEEDQVLLAPAPPRKLRVSVNLTTTFPQKRRTNREDTRAVMISYTNSISNLTKIIRQLNANLRGNRRTLHLVQKLPDFLEVGKMSAIRIQ